MTKVFNAWNPFLLKSRFNSRKTISVYSRFSIQEKGSFQGIAVYVDNNKHHIISFKPEYLGLYLENIEAIHLFNETKLIELIKQSDQLDAFDNDGSIDIDGQRLTITHTRYLRDPKFRRKVYEAYKYCCSMCGIQLELIEAAHIVPHSHEKGTDEIENWICLCSLHHSAYDKSIIYFDENFKIKLNEKKLDYLVKIGRDSGLFTLQIIQFEYLKIPDNHLHRPNIQNINLANEIRGINT